MHVAQRFHPTSPRIDSGNHSDSQPLCDFQRGRVARKVREASELQHAEAAKAMKVKIRKAKKRCDELDVLIQKLYESYALDKISEKRFDDFLAGYEKEQAELKAVLETDTEELKAYEMDSTKISSFLAIAKSTGTQTS